MARRGNEGGDARSRSSLKRAYADGTVAVDLDPLSLLCRLATSVPPPRFHTVKYAGVLAPASTWRSKIAPKPRAAPDATAGGDAGETVPNKPSGTYRPWAELLKRTFGVDVLECPTCKGRMTLLALVTEEQSIQRFLTKLGETTTAPERPPSRGPPYWKSVALRRKARGEAA